MINASKDKLQSYFHGNIQYKIPFFQRSYVWREDNWESLWENIFQVYTEATDNKPKEHFIGTLITKQIPQMKLGENWHDLIDGQQRLTTVSILFKSLFDCCKGTLPNLKNKIEELLVFKNVHDERLFRIELCRNDMPHYIALIQSDLDHIKQNKENAIIEAYDFFKKKAINLKDEDIDLLTNIILERVPVISMLLSSDDDEQIIFDTINSLGVKLTTAELLKNYIFKDKNLYSYFDTLWEPVFEADEETVTFWDKEKTSGRVIRNNVEVLLYCYLIIETQKEIKLEQLYKEYKSWLEKKTIDEKVAFLRDLKECADMYFSFPNGEELNEISYSDTEKRFFHIIENLSITTAYPLILYIYLKVPDITERNHILEFLESYLVRRNICRLTTKNYNNLFISIIQKLDKVNKEGNVINTALFKDIFTSFTEYTNIFPRNIDFEDSFRKSHLSNQNAREILFSIALFQKNSPYHDTSKLSSSSFSVEHILPGKWQQHWNNPALDDKGIFARNKALKTLGNLTLVTKRLNSKLTNDPWEKKKETLQKYSSLSMTTDYLSLQVWNEETISLRANEHYNNCASKMWKYYL